MNLQGQNTGIRKDEIMSEYPNDIIARLSDIGRDQDALAKAEKILDPGYTEALIRHLRLCRCDLVDQLAESRKRIDVWII